MLDLLGATAKYMLKVFILSILNNVLILTADQYNKHTVFVEHCDRDIWSMHVYNYNSRHINENINS